MSSKKNTKDSHNQNEWEKIDQAVVGSGQFVDKNLNKILAGIGIVVVVVCGYLAYHHFVAAPKLQAAQEAMYKGEQYYRQGMDSIAIFGDANGYIGFEGVIDQYGSTDAANVAKLYAAISYARMKQYDKALEYAKAFSANDEVLQHLAQGTIGDCLVNLGQAEEAIPYFIKAAKGADNMFQSPIMYKKAGLIYRDMGNHDKVIEIFTIVKNNYMQSPLAQEADKYIEEAKLLKAN